MNILNALNGNYFINKVNLSLEQTEQIAQIKINRLFKLNLDKLKKENKKFNEIILTNDSIICRR